MLGESKYYDVVISIETMTEKGTIKKTKEYHLVWGSDFKDIENKVKKEMEGTPNEWTIKSVKESNTTDVYGRE